MTTIRPPRQVRRRRALGPSGEIATVLACSFLVAIFGLRALLALVDVARWTAAWRVIGVPTQPLVDVLLRLEPLRHTPVGSLTLADLLLALVVMGGALLVLASLPLRRR